MSRIEITKNKKLYTVVITNYRDGTRTEYFNIEDMKYSTAYNILVLYRDGLEIGNVFLETPEDRIIWDPEGFDISIRIAIEHLEKGLC